MVFSEELAVERYKELTAKRDAWLAKVAPLEAKLDAAVKKANDARIEVEKISAEIDQSRDSEDWLKMKKEIAALARFLSKAGGVLASK